MGLQGGVLGSSAPAPENACGGVCVQFFTGELMYYRARLFTGFLSFCRICCAALLLAGLSAPGYATQEKYPVVAVTIGSYIANIQSLDIKAGTVEVDMYIWLRSRDARDFLDRIEVSNGSFGEKSAIVKKKIGDEYYSSMRIMVKAFERYDLRRFPLDKQELVISFEDAEDDVTALRFVPDTENTNVAGSVLIPGWRIGKARIAVGEHVYDTNYGDTSIGVNSSTFSRASITIPIEREGVGYFFKLFGTVFLSAAVAFLSFHIRPDDLDPRFGLGVGGIFAVVASNFVLSSMLPETHQITLGEALLLLTIFAIFAAIMESVLSLKYWESGRQDVALRIDRIAGWLFPIIYLVLCALIILTYL